MQQLCLHLAHSAPCSWCSYEPIRRALFITITEALGYIHPTSITVVTSVYAWAALPSIFGIFHLGLLFSTNYTHYKWEYRFDIPSLLASSTRLPLSTGVY